MNEEMWGFLLVVMTSTGTVSDADMTPSKVAAFQSEASCEAAGRKLLDKQRAFAREIKRDVKIHNDFLCIDQR